MRKEDKGLDIIDRAGKIIIIIIKQEPTKKEKKEEEEEEERQGNDHSISSWIDDRFLHADKRRMCSLTSQAKIN
jgi:hypothetical protein